MGICASCLGLTRHDSQDTDEIDRILADPQQPIYGTIRSQDSAQPDEEDLRREREALDVITAEAAEHMIDVLHPVRSEFHPSIRPNQRLDGNQETAANVLTEEEEQHANADEAAWLESIQVSGLDVVRMPQHRTLVMDMSQLHEIPHQRRAGNMTAVR